MVRYQVNEQHSGIQVWEKGMVKYQVNEQHSGIEVGEKGVVRYQVNTREYKLGRKGWLDTR